jgi:hypothetical protein
VHEGCSGAEPLKLLRQCLSGRVVDPVGLVEHHEIRCPYVPLQLRVLLACTPELGCVHDLDEAAVDDVFTPRGEDHTDHRLRFRQPAGLHDDDVHPRRRAGQTVQDLVEIARVHCAAQTAVAQRDHRIDLTGHCHRVDADASEVIDHRTDTRAATVPQQMVEQRGLAGAKESREDDDRYASGGHRGFLQRARRTERLGRSYWGVAAV